MKKSEIRALTSEIYAVLHDDQEACVERALQILSNAPEDPESFLLIAEVFEESERYDHALTWIDHGLSHHADHAGLLLKKASILLDGFEDIDEAFRVLSLINDQFGEAPMAVLKESFGTLLVTEVFLLLSDCYRLKEQFIPAFTFANKAHQISNNNEQTLLAVATAYFELGEYQKAHSLIEPIETKSDLADFYWQQALILCAEGKFSEADLAFAKACKANKNRYHRPVRLDKEEFHAAYEQALLALPREIRSFVNQITLVIADILPRSDVLASKGTVSPMNCISVKHDDKNATVVTLYQKNIENVARKRNEVRDIIASALLHDLGKLFTSSYSA